MAREVYNQEQPRFENRCFSNDVKDPKGTAVMDLQMKMLANLLGQDATKMCRTMFIALKWCKKKKLLLAVDDISEAKQFYVLRNYAEILTRLKLSYDGLGNEDDKCMFVDIACFVLLAIPKT